MEYKVYYRGAEPQRIESLKMNLEVDLDGDTAVFNDPMMVAFSDEAIKRFEDNVLKLPFVNNVREEFEEAYEEFDDD